MNQSIEYSGNGVVFQATFRPHRTFFYPSCNASEHGYFPKTHWIKLGRRVIEQEQPALAVAHAWITRNSKDSEIILAWNDLNQYLVTDRNFNSKINSRNSWPVYHETQTRIANDSSGEHFGGHAPEMPKVAKPPLDMTSRLRKGPSENNPVPSTGAFEFLCNKFDLKQTSSPLSLSPPYDVKDISKRVVTPCPANTLRRLLTGGRTSPKDEELITGRDGLYCPENFDWDSHPELSPCEWTARYIFHLIYLRRVIERRSRQDYIELKADYMRKVVPDFCKVIGLLLEREVIERDYYEQDSKSYGYRFLDEQHRTATHRLIPITDARLRKRLSDHRKKQANTALHRWLRKQLDRISLGDIDEEFLRTVAVRQTWENGGAVEDKIKAYAEALDLIQRQAWYWESGDKFGYRIFHNVSGLKRELRRLLRVHGQPLVEIDIKGSQLLFLALEMQRRGLPSGDFLERCQGDVYQYVADHAKTTRAKVKQAITQRALFALNDHRCQRSRIKRVFDRLFPEVADYVRESKADDHRELAKQLQRAESGFVLRTVCNRLRLERPDLFVVTIHDSILCLPNDAEYIRGVMLVEFGKCGVRPRLEIKELGEAP